MNNIQDDQIVFMAWNEHMINIHDQIGYLT